MINRVSLVLLVAIGLSLSACGTLKKFTKKNDSTVLPGTREEILSPDQYKVEDDAVKNAGSASSGGAADEQICDPEVNPNCASSIDQEAGASEG